MSTFHFKQFTIQQSNSALKVGTDAMLLGAFIDQKSAKSILDIGTGTGVLALMAKQKNPTALVTAIDIDDNSLIDCAHNFENSKWKDDLICLKMDFTDLDTTIQYDCIICNPPFYENSLPSATAKNNRAKHTIDFSLDALFTKVKSLLNPSGQFWIILPATSSDKWKTFASAIKLFPTKEIVLFGKENNPKRIIYRFELNNKPIEKTSLIIRYQDNSYSKEYIELTKDFHNKII